MVCTLFCPAMNHLSNGYDKPVYYFIDYDRDKVVRTEIKIQNMLDLGKVKSEYGGSYSEEKQKELANMHGYSRLSPSKTELISNGTHRETKYVSILSAGKFLCKCKNINCNDSVLVERDGDVRLTKMGTLWESRN